jgi:hypothetical protein
MTAKQLACSIQTVWRLEQSGVIRLIKLAGARRGRAYHLAHEIEDLIEARARGEGARP